MSSFLLNDLDKEILAKKLNSLISYLEENFSFYKNSFRKLNTKVESIEDIRKFQIIDKTENDIWRLAEEVLEKKPPAYFETSGTSGMPFPVIADLSDEKMEEFAKFIAEWLSFNESKKINRAVIALPFEMNPIGLKYFFALKCLGITVIPTGVRTHLCPTSKVLEIFERLKPELLIARPMETLRYAEAMKQLGKNPGNSSIKKIILTGEIVSNEKFKKISKLYGDAEVYSVYGLTEVDSGGMVSCNKYKYHLPTNPYLIVELLDNDMKTQIAENGKIGNIILTNTHKNYMPLLRYKTGDLGIIEAECDCGQFKTPIVNVLGRYKDIVATIDGFHVFPIHIENIIFKHDHFSSDYQIVKHGEKILLRLEWDEKKDLNAINSAKKQLVKEIFDKYKLRVKIKIYNHRSLSNKFGIAKIKAGTLHVFDSSISKKEINNKLKINYACSQECE